MRLLPILPFVFSLGALILGFLCLFAGSKVGFLDNFSVLTLNTSRIGQNIISSSTQSSNNPLSNLLHNLTDPIVSVLNNEANKLAGSFAKDVGLEDFYAVHLMDYCYGTYVPGPVPNATLSKSKIHKNVTHCSNSTAMFAFDPTAALQKSLDESGIGISLSDLDFPADLEKGIRALRIAAKASFVLYCIAIGFTFLTLIACIFWTSNCSDGGKGIAALEIIMATMACISFGIASAITTALAVKGDNLIDKYGKPIGISADRGNGFLGLTWTAFALMVLAGLCGCVGCFSKRNRQKVRPYGEKP